MGPHLTQSIRTDFPVAKVVNEALNFYSGRSSTGAGRGRRPRDGSPKAPQKRRKISSRKQRHSPDQQETPTCPRPSESTSEPPTQSYPPSKVAIRSSSRTQRVPTPRRRSW